MPDYSAGTASVRVRPTTQDFVRELNAQLKAVKDPGFTVSVSADTGQAAADIRRFREVESRNGMKLGVDVALGQAQADMAAFRARQRADGLTIKVDADTKGAETKLAALDRQAKSLGSMRDVLRLNVGAGLIAGISPAVTGLVELAGALQQVSSAALAVPGGIAGAAASIGTLALGLSGVSDAYKAVSAAADSAGKDQAASARAGVSASNNLRNAVVDEARARKDVANATRDARNELRDLHVEMRGGLINESRAILQAQQARERLSKGDYTDVRDALLDIQEADQRVLEVQSRNAEQAEKLNDARTKGIDGSDRVVAANEALLRSQQQVTEAQMASANAAASMSSAQTKAAEEMGKLGPNTQKFVETLVRMRPEFKAFRSAASEPLLAGKAEEFENFFNTVSPHIKTGMSQIATGWNQNISALFRSVSSSTGTGFIDRILGNTGEAQGKLTKAVDPIVRVIGTLSSAGSDVLPRLADATGRWADRMANALTEADNDGSLDAMINRGLDGMTNLGNGAINLGKTLNAITTAAGGGGSFLQWIQDSTDRMQKFLNSGEGQNKLRDYFAEGRELIGKVVDVLKELPGAMSGVEDAAHEYLGGTLSIVRDLASLMKEHPDLIKGVVLGYAAFKTVTPIVQGVGTVIGGISTGLTNLGTGFADARAKASENFGKIQTKFDEAGGPKGLGKFSGALSVLGAAGGPFGILAGTIASVAVPALMSLRDAHADAEKKVSDLNQRELELEATLDRVTGKMTAQSRDMLLQQAQSYDPKGPGAGIPGISQGDALKAATSLGINPKVYGDALAGNPAAQQQVRDILLKNNLIPEFAANNELGTTARAAAAATGLSQDEILQALIGAPGAADKYGAALEAAQKRTPRQADYIKEHFSLDKIAQQLSATGRASVLAGGALTYLNSPTGPAGQNVQERNQANYGRFHLSAAGRGFFGGDLQVNSSGSDYQIVAPELTPGLQASLQASSLPYKVNADGRSITITVPSGSPYIESYAKGGPTPNGRGTGPTGGHIVEVHGDEWILPAGARAAVGDKNLAALTAGRSFDAGGPVPPVLPGLAEISGTASGAAKAAAPLFGPGSSMGALGLFFGDMNPRQMVNPITGGTESVLPVANEVAGPKSVAAAAAKVSLSRSPAYTNHNIPLDPNNFYRGVNASSLEDLFDSTGVMRGYGKGGSDRLSFQSGFPNDLYVNGLVKSNMILEGDARMAISQIERRSGYAFIDQLERNAVESGQTPLRVWKRTAPEGASIEDIHQWEKVFDSFPKFDLGGPEEDPLNQGGTVAAPATVPVAPNPMGATGGVGNILGQILSGAQGTIGNLASFAQAGASMMPGAGGGSAVDPATTVHGAGVGALPGPIGGGAPAMDPAAMFTTRLAGMPGIAGLIGSAMSPNPGPALMSWGSNTAQYVANWGMDTLGKVGSTLWSGALGFFGLQDSILSPSNPYNQAAQQTGQFFLGKEGPVGRLLGVGGGGASGAGLIDPASLGAQYGVDDATLATLFGQTGDQSMLAAMSPGARAAIGYAQQHAIGQKYEYGGVGNTGGYDCSGIASAIYAAARGLPQGQRYFTTESDFAALGFVEGYKPGSLNIGVMRGGGGPNSHMAVTLPNGVAVESGGAHGTTSYGGDARGANTFPLQWHMDLPQGFEKGGPTPDVMGPVDKKGGHLAVVHPKEFMISARGRSAVSDAFLYKLNQGIVDPTELGLRGLAAGGPLVTGAVVQPLPPTITARTPVQTMNPTPTRPPTAAVTPSPRPSVAPTPGTPAPVAPPTNAPQQPQMPRSTAAAPAGPTQLSPNNGAGSALNHNIGWLNTLIESGASTMGNAASTIMSIASMGAGGAGVPGAGAIGAAGPFVAGLFKEGGKIVEGAVNVVSSSLVGNVPGSFGGPAGANPYGRVVHPEQQAPATAQPRGGNSYQFNGISDINRLMDRLELNDKMSAQATLAKFPG